MQELETWVDLASRGLWSITDNAFVGGVSPKPYLNAAKKILTTAERAGALKLAGLNTIASAFDERVLVAVVQMLRDLHKNDEAGAITPRTAWGYFDCLIPLLERNGEDAFSVRTILKTDSWLKIGRRNRTEMSPHLRSFCRKVVTDMNARIRFLSLHIQLRKKAILHLKAAQMTTGRQAERHLEKARRFGTCAAFAALETDAIPARVSSVLKTTFRGSGAWLCLGHRKTDDGRLMIPAAYVKNGKPLFATMSATSRLRGLETLRWYEKAIRPLFGDHQDNDHFFPAVQKPGQALPYCQLTAAAAARRIALDVVWHPFELNPGMAEDGENLREHLAAKYGTTPEDSRKARDRLTTLGASLGFTFDYADDMRMWNIFRAHQLIDWADEKGKGHDVNLALFAAFLSERRNISDIEVLADVAASAGFGREEAFTLLDRGNRGDRVREKEHFWTSRGITGVPAMVFQRQHIVVGAQGEDTYGQILDQVAGGQPA